MSYSVKSVKTYNYSTIKGIFTYYENYKLIKHIFLHFLVLRKYNDKKLIR